MFYLCLCLDCAVEFVPRRVSCCLLRFGCLCGLFDFVACGLIMFAYALVYYFVCLCCLCLVFGCRCVLFGFVVVVVLGFV